MRTFRSPYLSIPCVLGSLLLVGAPLSGCGSDGSPGTMDSGPVDAAPDAVVMDGAALDAATDQGPPAGALVHGTVSGLVSTQAVRLRLASGERLTVPANGAFTFETRIPWGETYEAALDLAPVGSTCEVTEGTGMAVEGMETTAVLVTCTPSLDITNPVYNNAFPDPAVVLHDDGYYYAFATTGGAMLRSRDVAHWEYAGNFITNSDGGWDWGTMGAGTWAPDVVRIAGRYVMYYTRSSWGDPNAAIGVAVADHPTGPWDNRGKLFDSLEIGVNNSIDAGVFVAEDGKVYMIWGSMRGNYLVELTADGLALANPSTAATDKIRVAGLDTSTGWTATTYEAAYVRYRNGYYYLFLSSGTCCDDLDSTYNVVVGRSASPTGPYVDHMGRAMTGTSRGYPVVTGSALFKGPGHNSLIEDANGDWWMLYHSYVVASPTGRRLLVDRLVWDDEGWPSVVGGVPSTHPFSVP